jgi:uncharacterized protein
MSLVEHRDEGIHWVRWVRPDAIATSEGEHTSSILLVPDAPAIRWPVSRLSDIDANSISLLLDLKPALVLLGTGANQQLPTPQVAVEFLRRGIGLEAMDNSAAARTYNLLASEGRRVVAAFLLPG